jgi:hypothetical protein
MKLPILASLACAAVAFGAAAQTPSPAKPQNACFRTSDLRNHTVAGDKTLYFDVSGHSVLKVETSGGCLAGVTSSDPIVMRNQTGTGLICNKLDLDISVRGARCIVTGFSRLTPEEVAALPKGVRP